MESVQVQGLTLTYSEDFSVMDASERARLRFAEAGEGVCLTAPERHILISVAWKLTDPLLPRLLGSRELAAWGGKKPENPMPFPDYKAGGLLRRDVGGRRADGVSYTYTANDIPMYGETLTVRIGRILYYFHLYARQALKEDSLPIWEELLAAARWE